MRDCAVDVPPPKFALFRELYPCIDVVNPATGILVRFHMFGLFLSNVDVAALVLLIAPSLPFTSQTVRTQLFMQSTEEWVQCCTYDNLMIDKILRRESLAHGREISSWISCTDVSGKFVL